MTIVPITSPDLDAAEVSWFAALCSDDYEFLGVPDGKLRSSWAHCSSIVKEAEAQGKGAASLDGKMIDAASEKMAKNLIATASAIKAAEAARQG